MAPTPTLPPDFQAAAFALASSVADHSAVALVRDVVQSFSLRGDEEELPGRALYPQYVGGRGLQFYGYLWVETLSRNSDTYPWSRLPELAEEERQILTAAHRSLSAFTARCLQPLAAVAPVSAYATVPYSKEPVSLEEHPPLNFFGETELEIAATAFGKHPAMDLALETAPRIPRGLTAPQFLELMEKMEREIERVRPREIERCFDGSQIPAPPLIRASLLPHLGALVCLRASLWLTCELLYQSVLNDGPISITPTDISNVGPRTPTAFGTTTSLTFLADRERVRLPFHAERVVVLHAANTEPSSGTVHELTGSSLKLGEASADVRLNEADRWMNTAFGMLDAAWTAWKRDR